jgi:Mrp family chromosome partitioning ATPase
MSHSDAAAKSVLTEALPWEPETATRVVSPGSFRRLNLAFDGNSRIVFHCDPNGVAVEQYRLLRHGLAEQFPQGGIVMVSSPAKGDGKTLNAVNLAWCLAETSPTLLAEVDLRQPTIAKVLGFRPHAGIELALSGQDLPETVVSTVNGLALHVAAVVKPQRDPLQILKGDATKYFLDWARKKFRWVVLDAPPVIAAADVPELASMADAVLMVVRVRTTPRELVEKSFQLVGSHLRGVILNEATLCSDSYYRYLSNYHAK